MNEFFSKLSVEERDVAMTSLALGELPEVDAARARAEIAADPELQRLYAVRQKTVELAREAHATDVAASDTSMRLNEERREKLLQSFRTKPAVPPMARREPRSLWYLPLAVAALLIGLLGVGVMILGGVGPFSYTLASASSNRRGWLSGGKLFEQEASKEAASDSPVAALKDEAQTSVPPSVDLGFAVEEKLSEKPAVQNPEPAQRGRRKLPSASDRGSTTALEGRSQDTKSLAPFGGAVLAAGGERVTPLPPAPPAPEPLSSAGSGGENRFGFKTQNDQLSLGVAPMEPRQNVARQTILGDDTLSQHGQIVVNGSANIPARPMQNSDEFSKALDGVTENLKKQPQAFGGVGFANSFGDNVAANNQTYEGQGQSISGAENRDWYFQAGRGANPAAAEMRKGLSDTRQFTANNGSATANYFSDTISQTAGAFGPASSLPSIQAVGKQDAKPNEAGTDLNAVQPFGSRSSFGSTASSRIEPAKPATPPMSSGKQLARVDFDTSAANTLLPSEDAGKKESKLEQELLRKRAPLGRTSGEANVELRIEKPVAVAPVPQPEILTRENAFSTFSLNVSDVSFKLAAASLERGTMPDAASIRSEEFLNAFDYRDPQPSGAAVGFVAEQARYPFAHNRDLLRLSIKTAAVGRESGRPLNVVLLLDNSGSMERADRTQIIQQCLRTLAAQFQPKDKLSVVTFARTARLWADGVSGTNVAAVAERVGSLTPEGGTNLEEAMDLAYRTALRHYEAGAMNRVILLTDGAANLGNVDPVALKAKIESFRKQGIALDCFGIGWEGYNDDLLEQLSRNGDGRYGFINSPEEGGQEFTAQLAGALRVSASDVKTQVEFNPQRVKAYRQIGYAKHQLTKEQFRDNTVDAAELGAAEAGNALYVIETTPLGIGPIATVRVRYKIPGTSDYREHEWLVDYTPSAPAMEQASPAMRLACVAAGFSEWLAGSPFANEISSDRLLALMRGVPETFGADPRPKRLEWMVRQAKSISGK